jgi:hypothetical protein
VDAGPDDEHACVPRRGHLVIHQVVEAMLTFVVGSVLIFLLVRGLALFLAS